MPGQVEKHYLFEGGIPVKEADVSLLRIDFADGQCGTAELLERFRMVLVNPFHLGSHGMDQPSRPVKMPSS